jgi:hypothetical protein
MKTYKEHYEYCRSIYKNNHKPKYESVYDLTVDDTFLDEIISPKYYELINKIRQSINAKIYHSNPKHSGWPYTGIEDKHHVNCFIDRNNHAVRVNNWFDINEIYELTNLIMPVIEKDVLGCSGKVEYLHPYRNIPLMDGDFAKSSWKWHYDDCPVPFLKLFINLNEVTDDSGCLKYFKDKHGNIPTIETFNTVAGIRNTRPAIYESSRIPPEVIKKGLEEGGEVVSVKGKPGSYAICTPNIYHKASSPKPNTVPRDVLFFFIRPSIKQYENYLEDTFSYFPERNVKQYQLD